MVICRNMLVMYSGSKSRGRVRGLFFGVGSGSGSTFWVRVGFEDQHFGDVPFGFRGFIVKT